MVARGGGRALLSLLAVAFLGAVPAVALARGGKPAAARPPEWGEEEGAQVVRVFEAVEMKAFVFAPSERPAGKKPETWVCLHGHGGTATGLFSYGRQASEGRGAVVVACEGTGSIVTDRGTGHTWGDRDVDGVLACVAAAVEKHDADPKRVVLLGLSAGGSMSLATLGKKPSAFAGAVTCASPRTPDSSHKGCRVAVVLGTTDANFSVFPAARQAAEKTVVGRVVSVTDLPHELPDALYARECVTWVLESKAPSETLWLPKDPAAPARLPPEPPTKAKGGAGFRHVLLFAAGGRGAPEGAPDRAAAKAAAAALLAEWKKAAPADLDAAIAAKSQDPVSKDAGGRVTGAVLARYGGPLSAALTKAKGGEWSGPVESDAGWHLVTRDP